MGPTKIAYRRTQSFSEEVSWWCRDDEADEPWMHEVIKGSALAFKRPPPRPQCLEFQQRLAKLRAAQQEKEYQEMTQDVTRLERETRLKEQDAFATFKDQIGFGLHVVVIMYTCYLLGEYAGQSFSSSSSAKLAGGLGGMCVGMFVETFLFIIRTTRSETHVQSK